MSETANVDSVAIIGAGIAGLSCAYALKARGIEVTVFEKSRGPGGRMSTRRVSRVDESMPNNAAGEQLQQHWQCDHGAQYFTARHPLFVEQVGRWLQTGVVAPWLTQIKTIGPRPDALTDAPAEHSKRRYVGVPGMTAPARQMAENITVRANTRIVALNQTAAGWMLRQQGDARVLGPFSRLVLAIPAQQAAELLDSLNESSRAPDEALTYALAACHRHALLPCWALMLHFQRTAGEENYFDAGFDATFVNADVDQNRIASWVACDSSKPGRPPQSGDTWLLHATPEWSQQHLESDQQLVYTNLVNEFRQLTGLQTEVSAFSLHRWRFAQTGDSRNCPAQIWFDDMRLGLCGDWLNGGRVEGAWLSGHQLAQQIPFSALT